jgi:polyhydroxyalkanoate synthesis regulator phasin
MTSLRKRVTIGLLGAALVAGGGIAYAATKSSDPRDAYLNDVAQRLNVTPEKLREAMKGASLDQLEQAVKDGNLTQEQADAMKQKIEAGGAAVPFFGGGPGKLEMHGGPGPHFGFGFKAFGAELDAVAKYLDLSTADLRKQLTAGKSLADVAKAQKKDLDGLKKVITDEAKSHLDQAVKDGKLTQKQADEIAKELADHVDDIVTLAAPRIRDFRGGHVMPAVPGLPAVPGAPRFRGGGPGPRWRHP